MKLRIVSLKNSIDWGSAYKLRILSKRDTGSTSGLGRAPGEGHGSPLQYSCLEDPLDRGDCQATVHRFAKSQIRLK